MDSQLPYIPAGELQRYEHTRERNLQVCAELLGEPAFQDGVFFVPLAAFTAANSQQPLMVALADSLKLDLKGPVPLQAQFLNYMRDKDMLLILDNFDDGGRGCIGRHYTPVGRFVAS